MARLVAPTFERVLWRSVRNAPSFAEWSSSAIGFLSDQRHLPPETDEARVALILNLLRERRCLVVLDNLELLLESAEHSGAYRPGYRAYGDLARALGQSDHQSCLLVTSREALPELAELGGERSGVRDLELGGLDVAEVRTLLGDKHLSGTDAAWTSLVDLYGGNALALRIVGETIHQVFGGDVDVFIEQATPGAVFGGIRLLLDSQVQRLSMVEQDVLRVLALNRVATTFGDLMGDFEPRADRSAVMEALESLRRRSLVERADASASFRLPSVVLEYITDELVQRAAGEVEHGRLNVLVTHPVLKAQAHDYVREAQERLIARPLLTRLIGRYGSETATQRALEELLAELRDRPPPLQGFGPGNVINLLRLLKGDLRSFDLSGLQIRHAFLQDIEAQDATLVGSRLSQTVLADAFSYPTCVALSRDGVTLAAGTTTGEICLWRVDDRALLATLRGHEGLIQNVALSDDGERLASSSEDGTIRIWQTGDSQVLTTLHTPSSVRTVALSGDGHVVAGGGHDGLVQLWDVESARLLRSNDTNNSGVRSLALSQDGAALVSGHADGSVQVWQQPSNGRASAITRLLGHDATTWTVAVSADGGLVASGSVDTTVRVWKSASRDENWSMTLRGHTGAVWSVATSGDGRVLASGSFDGTIRMWDPERGAMLATLQGHTAGVRSVALSGGGDLLASCSYDGTVRIWRTLEARLLATLRGHTSSVRGVAVSSSGHLVASGSYDGSVRFWDAVTGAQLRRLNAHEGGVWNVALSADGRLAASGSFDGTIKVRETDTGRLVTTVRGQRRNEVWGVALSADGSLVASGSYDGTLSVWDAQTGALLSTIEGHIGGVWGVALGERQSIVASGGEDGTVKLWEALTGQRIATLGGGAGSVWNVALSDNGSYVAGGGEDGAVRVWDIRTGQLITTLANHVGGAWSVALSSDGDVIATGSFDGLIRVWRTRTGELLWPLTGHSGAVWSLALSNAGTLLASGGFDGTLRLWDVRSGALLHTMRPDRRYERMDITDLTGITGAQREALLVLGASTGAVRRDRPAVLPGRKCAPRRTEPQPLNAPKPWPGRVKARILTAMPGTIVERTTGRVPHVRARSAHTRANYRSAAR